MLSSISPKECWRKPPWPSETRRRNDQYLPLQSHFAGSTVRIEGSQPRIGINPRAPRNLTGSPETGIAVRAEPQAGSGVAPWHGAESDLVLGGRAIRLLGGS